MTRYIALLRGVNISGKNKVSMPELKQYCTELGYDGVVTYLNSGNIVFSKEDRDEQELAEEIKNLITENFGLDMPAFVIKQTALREILDSAPEWWGTDDKDIYDNLIFVMPPADAYWVSGRIGTPTEGLEQIEICRDDAIFWSFDRKRYQKANWWKSTASRGIGEVLTIRTANTLRKIAEL